MSPPKYLMANLTIEGKCSFLSVGKDSAAELLKLVAEILIDLYGKMYLALTSSMGLRNIFNHFELEFLHL